MSGFVSLVGVGPGDPGLITVRGARALARADAILHHPDVHPLVFDHARPDAERLAVSPSSPRELLELLLARTLQGRRAAWLAVGDPLLFSPGAEVAALLVGQGVPFEVIPGVTAALGAGAYTGIALTHRELSSSVVLVASTERRTRLPQTAESATLEALSQTLVLYTDLRGLADDLASLVSRGHPAHTPAALVAWGTRAAQRVVRGTVADLASRAGGLDPRAPVVVIVGEVVRLRDTLRWWDTGPLFGRRVLVTRAREQAGTLVTALLDAGAEPVVFPAIRFEAPSDPARVPAAVDDLAAGRYDAVAFTSQNGVERFFRALEAKGLDARAFGKARVVAIGPATREALAAEGVRADATAKEFRGEGVAEAVSALFRGSVSGLRVLLPRAEVAREALPETLRAAGASVDVVPVYRTVSPEGGDLVALTEQLSEGRVDVVTFTSSSTVTNLCDALGSEAPGLLGRALLASIGPVTSETARARGLRVDVEASTYTIPGLLDALNEHLRTSPGATRP